jgi:hypothetical protein
MKITYHESDDILHVQLTLDRVVRDESHGWNVNLGFSESGLAEITILGPLEADRQNVRNLLADGGESPSTGPVDGRYFDMLRERTRIERQALHTRIRHIRGELVPNMLTSQHDSSLKSDGNLAGTTAGNSVKTPAYDEDFYLWAKGQAMLLRFVNQRDLDVYNLIREVEAMAESRELALRAQLEQLVSRLLLLQLSAATHAYPGWSTDVQQMRATFMSDVAKTPSLKSLVPKLYAEAWPGAVAEFNRMMRDLGETIRAPEACPFELVLALCEYFHPINEGQFRRRRIGFAKEAFEVPDDFDSFGSAAIAKLFEEGTAEEQRADLVADVIKVVGAVLLISDYEPDAIATWFRGMALKSFGGKTAWQLVREERTEDLLRYLSSLESGFVG